jgi:hypothetical protein
MLFSGSERFGGSGAWARCAVWFSVLALSCSASRGAFAQSTYGTLSNFDVFNDTGEECHGFEIELDGLSSKDVTFTFGSPYQRYGDARVIDFPGGVYVRYESPYVDGAFTQATPLAPAVITPTNGHACWTGGSADYPTSGCEHFGVGLAGNPTNSVYRWLVADPAAPGTLRYAATKVSIPAPSWNVAPPQGGGNPVVRAVIPAEPPEVHQEYGDAMWVKVFVTESEQPAELHHLVTDDPAVPDEASETEVEWTILQAGPPGKGNDELANEGKVGAGKVSVTRRYEFYEYTGAYDPENHEVMCGGDGGCDAPLVGELGNYIGAQMAAVNLVDLQAPTPTPTVGPTPTPPPAVCVGNCNGDDAVGVNEIIVLVNVALGTAEAAECADGLAPAASVDIAVIVQAVNNALNGCAAS